MQIYRSARAKNRPKTARKCKRLSLRFDQRKADFRLYRGILLSGAQYTAVLQASVNACIADFNAATKEDCNAFIQAGGGAYILSSFGRMLLYYGTDPLAAEVLEKYPEFFGALQFFTRIAENRMQQDFLQPRKTKTGQEAFICKADTESLASDLAWTDGVFERAILRAAFWYDAPRTARVWINALSTERIAKQLDKEIQALAAQIREKGEEIPKGEAEITDEEIEQILAERAKLLQLPRYKDKTEKQEQEDDTPKKADARAKTQFGAREEKALFPERGTKRQREDAGIRSTALTNIAVIAAKTGSLTIKEPRLRSLSEAFDEAAPSMFSGSEEDILPAKKEAEPIPKNIYDYYAVIQTGIIDDLKKGGDGHYYTDIYAFCKTLGLTVNARSLPEILKAFEQIGRISPDFGDAKIHMQTISATLDPETGVIDFYGATIIEAVRQIQKYNTEVLKDPGKEFAPKNIKAELLRQKDTEAKNAIRQVIAPGIELRGASYNPGNDGKKADKAPFDYSVSYRTIINKTDGFIEALEAARKKTRGYETRFLQRKLDNIQEYLQRFTEYPTRYKEFQVFVVQPNKAGGSAILDTILHVRHKGLADPADGQRGDAGAGAKHSAEAEP